MAIIQRLAGVGILAAAMIAAGYPLAHARSVSAAVKIELAQAQTDTPASAPAALAPSAPESPAAAVQPSTAASPESPKPPGDKPAVSADSKAAAPAVYPSAIDPKYAREPGLVSRMRTCADQFTANKASNANGGLRWIDRSGGYYGECIKHLKG